MPNSTVVAIVFNIMPLVLVYFLGLNMCINRFKVRAKSEERRELKRKLKIIETKQ